MTSDSHGTPTPSKAELAGHGAPAPWDATSEEVGLQYPAPKTRFSRERLDGSDPASGPPLPSQEPLPGRVKLERREGKREELNVQSDGLTESAPWGAGGADKSDPVAGVVPVGLWASGTAIRGVHGGRRHCHVSPPHKNRPCPVL